MKYGGGPDHNYLFCSILKRASWNGGPKNLALVLHSGNSNAKDTL